MTVEFEATINLPPRLVIMSVIADHATMPGPHILTHYVVIDSQKELQAEWTKFVDDMAEAGYTPVNSLFTVVDPETVRKLCKRYTGQPATEVTE